MDKELFPEETIKIIQDVNRGLKRVSKLWQEYYNTPGRIATSIELAMEVDKRFRQLKFLFAKLVKLEKQSRINGMLILRASVQDRSKAPNDLLNKDNKVGFQIELYTEACYYLAFRLVSLVAKITRKPVIKSGAKGIVLVRNLLIEHSDKLGGITTVSFGHVGQFGAQVKPGRVAGEENGYHDRGLYKNLEEMLTSISRGISSK